MATRAETSVVYAAGVVQGIALEAVIRLEPGDSVTSAWGIGPSNRRL